ncbi:DUF6192 family protein [Streptomyces iakyrus]|uniref:DUF6192 family protein n=1 Tax=Streptomyces iakyrus TaxID=68219 RepID=UPI003D93C22E
MDDANRRVGQQVETLVTPQEKVTGIHSLAQGKEVAAAVTTDFLKRQQVAAKVLAEDKVRWWRNSLATRRLQQPPRPAYCAGQSGVWRRHSRHRGST